MKKTLKLLALASVLSALSVAAKADPLAFTATLVGTQEVPANSSPGVGNALVTVDGNMMTVNVTFSGLIGNTTVAHIHCCVPPGVNAIVATTTPTFMGFPAGVTAGTYMRTLDLTLASTYNPMFVAAQGGTVAQAQAAFLAGLLSGQTYFNIHTTTFGGGRNSRSARTRTNHARAARHGAGRSDSKRPAETAA